ncbi:hypothetical protein HYC85_009227 [Camellia sinensis]|uniref:Uncharacterized protein n=1 Tax=Camellia sinensis TaxID=4442 RepID=A0A7J7HEF1_CAMSI|nr:hypothetical protein HYC85_009227 [Camellia sinensis]
MVMWNVMPVSWMVILGHFELLERCQQVSGMVSNCCFVGQGTNVGVNIAGSNTFHSLVTKRANRQREKYKSMLDDAKAMKAEIDGELSSSTRANVALSGPKTEAIK